ncbi:MAG: pyridoxal 5'-phosphate synthase glutaminase subunit PdxT [Calditrichaceae bacterium]|nr:pyridoxal 5'-phosphate synthase glutaminase subunit PdxT [Calditrichaceae bacterium]MBN2709018.1 pyridoxal 5'-phosphate synthase glutaminase subunit PdxT [Calditrichaceae bacterium]RQV95330.1 MAG: pyridoxal 5'-phosphate synthase glutaminase subunit PdxT [Calditrichota bacterium]
MQNIGILALQGDFDKHRQAVEKLGQKAVLVKDVEKLSDCDRLIIPGGESTTFLHLVEKLQLRQGLIDFIEKKPVFGTCAGLILLSKSAEKLPFPPLGVIDIIAKRNAYGRQVDSFVDDIRLNLNGRESVFEGVFIRAPKIKDFGKKVNALAWHNNDVVMAESGKILVAAFHPELTDDLSIHQYFIEK